MFEATPPGEPEDEHAELDVHDRDGVEDVQGLAVLTGPIVGRDMTSLDDRGPGALAAKPVPPPQQPS